MILHFDNSGEIWSANTSNLHTCWHISHVFAILCILVDETAYRVFCYGWPCDYRLSFVVTRSTKAQKNPTLFFLSLLSTYSVGRAGWQGWLDQRLEQAGVECGEVGQHVDRMAAQRFEGFQWHLRKNIGGMSLGGSSIRDVGLMNNNQHCISFLGYLGQSSGWRDLHFAGHAPRCSLEREGGRGWPNHGVLGSPALDKGETQQHPRQALPLPTHEMAIWAGMGMWLLYRQDFEGINGFF